ncbi:MAG TPA: metallopeptidase family protein [Polyangiaceae bacterium]|nr:metallopeptidase family protein [Polyangiaceae bacterium]
MPVSSDEFDERALDLVLEVEEQLESNPLAALNIAEHAPPESATHPEVRLARARALMAAKGASSARAFLEQLVGAEPDFAEARHALALALEELGDQKAAVRELLAVRRLDEAADRADGFDLAAVEGPIVAAAEQVLAGLPERFKKLVADVPILVEERPSEELVSEGFDPRSLGLFSGPTQVERSGPDVVPAPTRIVLYAANLAAYADPSDADELRHEVEVTVLHEIGHYFGLDEDDLDALGLG